MSADQDTERLSTFINDLLRVGSVKGFRFFRLDLRGREELVMTARASFADTSSHTKM
jgi:hypothetical protein